METLLEERLVLVLTDPAGRPEPGPGYVYMDWGPEFYARQNASFPDFIGPGLTANIGWLGLQHILENGGSGYFPERLARPHLDHGRLTRLTAAPEFSLPAYVVFPTDSEPDLLGPALHAMRSRAASGPRRRA